MAPAVASEARADKNEHVMIDIVSAAAFKRDFHRHISHVSVPRRFQPAAVARKSVHIRQLCLRLIRVSDGGDPGKPTPDHELLPMITNGGVGAAE